MSSTLRDIQKLLKRMSKYPKVSWSVFTISKNSRFSYAIVSNIKKLYMFAMAGIQKFGQHYYYYRIN